MNGSVIRKFYYEMCNIIIMAHIYGGKKMVPHFLCTASQLYFAQFFSRKSVQKVYYDSLN